VNFLLQKLNKSSREGPSKSMTMAFYSLIHRLRRSRYIIALSTEPTNERNSNTPCKCLNRQNLFRRVAYLVHPCFVFQLRMLCFCGFKFDGDFFSRDDISTYIALDDGSKMLNTKVDISKTTGSDFATDSILKAS
jgi:hypothetical protein